MHLNARETLNTLTDKGIIPVINENDTVSTGEIRFGDNDRLAARVGQMIQADLVILLSTTNGLYTADPGIDPEAKHFPVVEEVTDAHLKMAGDAIAGLSTGGMKSKVEAAQSAMRAGIPLIIADGRAVHALKDFAEQENTISTVFLARETSQNARKKWIQAHLRPKGAVFVDKGAFKALEGGKSLLPIGVTKTEGSFERGDVVVVKDPEGREIGVGLSAYSSADAQKVIGRRSQDIHDILGYAGRDEMIHRNDLVLK
jgi:glutamate 5-kinase